MKHLSIAFYFLLFTFYFSKAQTIVDPEDFPEKTTTTGTEKIPFRENGANRTMTTATQKKYFTPDVRPTPVGFTPTPTGNTLNLMEFVEDPAGNYWFIDSQGDAFQLGGTGGVADPSVGGDLSGTASNAQIVAAAVGSNELAPTGVTAGSYGSATQVPVITLDEDGRVLNVSLATIAAGSSATLDGVSNPGGDINLVAGANTTIVSDNVANTITISATGGGGGGLSDGDYGDITVSGSGSVMDIDAGAVGSAEILDGSVALGDLAFTPLTSEVDGSTTNELSEYTPSASEPGSPKQGDFWHKTGTDTLFIYDDGAWVFAAIRAGSGGGASYTSSQLRDSVRANIFQEIGENHVIVWILTGQSNAEGGGGNASIDASLLDANEDVKIWNTVTDSWEDLNIGAGNNKSRAPGTQHGAEAEFQNIRDTFFPDKTLYLIKKADGGTKIDCHLPGGVCYDSTYTHYVKEAINNLVASGKIPLASLYKMQGESNASGTLEDATSYADDFKSWVQQWRYNLGGSLPIVVGKVDQGYTYTDSINNAFQDAARLLGNIALVETKDYPKIDGDHFNDEGQKRLARGFFDGLVAMGTPGVPILSPLPIPVSISRSSVDSFEVTYTDSVFYDFDSYSTPTNDTSLFRDWTGSHRIVDTLNFGKGMYMTGTQVKFSPVGGGDPDNKGLSYKQVVDDSKNVSVSMKMRFMSSGSGGPVVKLGKGASGMNGYWIHCRSADALVNLNRISNGNSTTIGSSVFSFTAGEDRYVKIEAVGDSIHVYASQDNFNFGAPIISVRDTVYQTGTAGHYFFDYTAGTAGECLIDSITVKWGGTYQTDGEAIVNFGNSPDVNLDIGTKNLKPVFIQTNEERRMVIDQLGYVGIGRTTAREQLHVNGGILLDATATGEKAGTIKFDGDDFFGRIGDEWYSLTDTAATTLDTVLIPNTTDVTYDFESYSTPTNDSNIIRDWRGSHRILDTLGLGKRLYMTGTAIKYHPVGGGDPDNKGYDYKQVPDTLDDVSISMKMHFLAAGSSGAVVRLNQGGSGMNGYWAQCRAADNSVVLQKISNGNPTTLGSALYSFTVGEDRYIQLEAVGDSLFVRASDDGITYDSLLLSAQDATYPTGSVGHYTFDFNAGTSGLCLIDDINIEYGGVDTVLAQNIVNHGNSFGSKVVVGSNDANSLELETNNTVAITINTSQDVGIGDTSPDRKLHVKDSDTVGGTAKFEVEGTGTGGVAATLFFDDTSGANDDDEVRLNFTLKDNLGNETVFATLVGVSGNVTNGSENGALVFKIAKNAAISEVLSMSSVSTNFTIPDNVANSFRLREGVSTYFNVETTDAQPIVSVNNGLTDIDFTIGTSSTADAFKVNAGADQIEVNEPLVIIDVIKLGSTGNVIIASGTGSPEGSLAADVGSTYHRTDGGAGTSFYVKESGTGNTGWAAK